MDDVTLYTGECAQVMRERIADGSIDLTVTSPPYDNLRTYRGFVFDFEAIAAQLWRVTKPGGVVVWVVADATINGSETGTSFRQALHFMGLGFNLHDTMIYEVAGTGAKGSNLAYWQAFEYMFVFSNGTPEMVHRIADRENVSRGHLRSSSGTKNVITNTRLLTHPMRTSEHGFRTNIWRYGHGNMHGDLTDHPAPFPEALARDHIVSWSNPGDVVLDPMMGSGTTGKMAVQAGRRFIGIDIAAEYVELARERIGRTQLQPALFQPTPAAEPPARGLWDEA